MQLDDYFEFLDPHDIRIKGHRIGIETVLYEYIYRERTPEQIAREYDTLTLEEVYATILYYLHNKEAVTKYIADWMEYCRQSREENMRQHADWYAKMRRLMAEYKAKKRVHK